MTSNNTADLGAPLGQLKSTSEGLQKGVCIIAMIGGVATSFIGVPDGLSVVAMIFATCLLACVLYVVAKQCKRFSDRMEMFEEGIVLTLRGKVHRFRFADVEEFSIDQTHHLYNGNYIGTRVTMEFLLEGRLRPVRCDLECHKDKSSGTLIANAGQRVNDALRDRLAARLEGEGELRWGPNVFLTLDGLRVSDGSQGADRIFPLEEIDRWGLGEDRKLQFWRRAEAMPFLVMPVELPNFHAIAALFESLHACYRQQDVKSVAEVSGQIGELV